MKAKFQTLISLEKVMAVATLPGKIAVTDSLAKAMELGSSL